MFDDLHKNSVHFVKAPVEVRLVAVRQPDPRSLGNRMAQPDGQACNCHCQSENVPQGKNGPVQPCVAAAIGSASFKVVKPLLHLFQALDNLVHRGVHAVALLFLSRRSATGGNDSATVSAVPSIDWSDPERIAAATEIGKSEPQTVVIARALVADPATAQAKGRDERHAAWLVALADLRHRRSGTAQTGGTAA